MAGYTNSRRGPPTSGFYNVGDVCQDRYGIVWLCYDSGFPGQWLGNLTWNWAATPLVGALALTGGAVSANPLVNTPKAPLVGSLTMTGIAPLMNQPYPRTGGLTLTGTQGGKTFGLLESVGAATITGRAPTVVVQ